MNRNTTVKGMNAFPTANKLRKLHLFCPHVFSKKIVCWIS